jgi:hypothetical protein
MLTPMPDQVASCPVKMILLFEVHDQLEKLFVRQGFHVQVCGESFDEPVEHPFLGGHGHVGNGLEMMTRPREKPAWVRKIGSIAYATLQKKSHFRFPRLSRKKSRTAAPSR